MAKMELEVGPSQTGVMLAIKSGEGRVHQVMAIEVTNDEALKIANLIMKRVEDNRRSENPSELN